MNIKKIFIPFIALIVLQTGCKSGLVTTSNSCYNLLTQADASQRSKNYTQALAQYTQVLENCKAFDAKQRGYAGKAAAQNGLKQYADAYNTAMDGLSVNKNSVDIIFQKANAELGLNRTTDAQTDFQTVISLTANNRNVKERATIYAKMAEINLGQNRYDDAMNNVAQAIALDAGNPDFYMLQGDIQAQQSKYAEANTYYDMAISHGKDDAIVWKAKTINSIQSYEKKYNTTDVQTLAAKMDAGEKANLCKLIKDASDKGVQEVSIDLLKLSICK
ncbi:MAG: tetratricopeptide repeat protein [Chitinophagaceae bacterium]